MKICLYTGSALPKLGGQEAVVDSLARQFLQMGHEPIVMAPMPRLPLWPRDSLLPYPVIRHPRFFSTRHFVSWYRWFLLRANARHRFDVIHCHDVYPTGYVASLCRSATAVPLVITSHGGDVRAGNARLNKSGMRDRFIAAVAAADAIISIGRFTTDGFKQLGAADSKIHAIPNGVDLAPFRQRVERPMEIDDAIQAGKYLLFMGRLSRRKGVDLLIQAMAIDTKTEPGRAPDYGPDIGSNRGGTPRLCSLVIAGSGDERSAIEQQIASENLGDRVHLVGRVEGDTKTWLLQNAQAVVMPSRGWEAFPLVVLEAYAAGVPVIGSRIAGLEDVVIPGETGLLFEPESVESLAAALQRVRDDPAWAGRAGANAKARAADYGWDQIASRHLELYRSTL